MPTAAIFLAASLNSAQVVGRSSTPALSIAALLPHIQSMRWMFIGVATQVSVGFITSIRAGATSSSQFSAAATSLRSVVMPVAAHSAISGPLSWTAGGALPATTSARSLAMVLALLPATDVCSQAPPASSNISPSFLIASASEPRYH